MKKILLGMLAIILLAGCDVVDEFEKRAHVSTASTDIGYTTFEIEGMPCIIVGRKSGGMRVWAYDGVTCDWTKHKDPEGNEYENSNR